MLLFLTSFALASLVRTALVCVCRSPQYRYFCETDTLSVYFVKAVPGLIDNTEDAVDGLLVDYTEDQKIVSFDVRMASVRTRAHFWDTATDVQGAPPLCLRTEYSEEADTFTVSFVDSPQHCKSVCTDDDRISVWVNDSDKWESVVIAHAMESIAK